MLRHSCQVVELSIRIRILRLLLPITRLFYTFCALIGGPRQVFLIGLIRRRVFVELVAIVVRVAVMQGLDQFADDAFAHPLVGPQALVLVTQLLLQVFVGAGVKVLVHLE